MGKHKPKELGENPFLQTFENSVFIFERGVVLNEYEKGLADGGVITALFGDSLTATRRVVVEADKSVVEYKNHGDFDCSAVIMKLPPKALRMYEYVKRCCRVDETIINIDFEGYKNATGVTSYSTFTSDRGVLVQNGIISPSLNTSWYWTNPVFFFNGNRASALVEHNAIKAQGMGGSKKK